LLWEVNREVEFRLERDAPARMQRMLGALAKKHRQEKRGALAWDQEPQKDQSQPHQRHFAADAGLDV